MGKQGNMPDESNGHSFDFVEHYKRTYEKLRNLSDFQKYDPRNDTIQTSSLRPSTISRGEFFSRLRILLTNFHHIETPSLRSMSAYFPHAQAVPALTQLIATVKTLVVEKPLPPDDLFLLSDAQASNDAVCYKGIRAIRRGSSLLPTLSADAADTYVAKLFAQMSRVCYRNFEAVDVSDQLRSAAITKLTNARDLTDTEMEGIAAANGLQNSARSIPQVGYALPASARPASRPPRVPAKPGLAGPYCSTLSAPPTTSRSSASLADTKPKTSKSSARTRASTPVIPTPRYQTADPLDLD